MAEPRAKFTCTMKLIPTYCSATLRSISWARIYHGNSTWWSEIVICPTCLKQSGNDGISVCSSASRRNWECQELERQELVATRNPKIIAIIAAITVVMKIIVQRAGENLPRTKAICTSKNRQRPIDKTMNAMQTQANPNGLANSWTVW